MICSANGRPLEAPNPSSGGAWLWTSAIASTIASAIASAIAIAIVLMAVAPVEAKGKAKGKAKKELTAEELFNPMLGVAYSHWLVGPIAQIAAADEIQAYLRLASDDQAKAFLTAFWAKRNEDTPVFKDTPQQIFTARLAEADKRFTEAVYPGSRTDRGIRFVLYGEPESISFEKPERLGDPTPELWTYAKDATPGLNGDPPERRYRFVKDGEFTVLLNEHIRRKQQQRNLRRRIPPN